MPFHLNNNLKKAMKQLVIDKELDFNYNKFILRYRLYLPDNRLRDISNVCCIVDKYVCDALVENGNIPDDNYTYLETVIYELGGVDIDNPRCEVEVWECLDT
jgi:acetylglutamate synthase